jgi:hypothetical protein
LYMISFNLKFIFSLLLNNQGHHYTQQLICQSQTSFSSRS